MLLSRYQANHIRLALRPIDSLLLLAGRKAKIVPTMPNRYVLQFRFDVARLCSSVVDTPHPGTVPAPFFHARSSYGADGIPINKSTAMLGYK
jgi:hypothetical protein